MNRLDLYQVQKCPNLIMLIVFHAHRFATWRRWRGSSKLCTQSRFVFRRLWSL